MNPANDAAAATEAPALVFTDSAAVKVGELIREEGNPNLKLRVFVSGGGCSGFQYGFTFDENEEEGDTCVVTLPEGFQAFEAEVQVRSNKLRFPMQQSFPWKVDGVPAA